MASRGFIKRSFCLGVVALQLNLQKQIDDSKKDLNELLKKEQHAEFAPKDGPESLIPMKNEPVRERLKNLLDASIKMKSKQLDRYSKQMSYVTGEAKIGSDLEGRENTGAISKKPQVCSKSPLVTDLTIQRAISFGQPINPALGPTSAKSQGIWWKNTLGAFVRSCDAGEIVLSEFVEGRGQVVGVKHKSKLITLYGNLDPLAVKDLKLGMKIARGAPLGTALTRFYFEARVNGEAINPDIIWRGARSAPSSQDSDIKSLVH